jgi:6-phosphogluconolactonase
MFGAEHEIRIFYEQEPLMREAASFVVEELSRRKEGSRIALTGGRTPKPFYELLVRVPYRDQVDWEKVRFAFIDERCVPPEDERSNFRMTKWALFAPLSVSDDRALRLHGEDPPEKGAEHAHQALTAWAQRVPLFDLVFFGLGADGHVASLFPAESWPDFGTRLAAATRDPKGLARITLTPGALKSTRKTMFLVEGENKAEAVRDTLTAGEPSTLVPATKVVAPETPVVWFLDKAAASLLPEELVKPRS